MTPPEIIDVLRRTQVLIKKRGWSATLSLSASDPINLRQAIAMSCTELAGVSPSKEWYRLYLGTVSTLTKHLQSGISSWEFDVKSGDQVDQMLTKSIDRVQHDAR